MKTQLTQVLEVCQKQQNQFVLSEVYAALPHILQPNIRALLQQVRNKGVIQFVDNQGTYKLV